MIDKIDHVAIVVENIDEALRTYSEAFGFEVIETNVGPENEFKSAMISSGAVKLELIEPLDPNGSIARFLKKRGGGMHHISLRTDDIEHTLRSLRAKGMHFVNEEPLSLPSARIAFIHPKSTGGVLIELLERT